MIWLPSKANLGRLALFVSVMAILAVSGAWFLYFKSRQPKQELETEVSVSGRVHALGRLEPRGTVVRIDAPSGTEGSRVERLHVEEGQNVESGQLLIELDMRSRRAAAVAEARASLDTAHVRLEQVKAGAKKGDIAAAEAARDLAAEQLEVAKRELDRAVPLGQKRVLPEEDIEKRRWSVDRAVSELHRAEALLASVRDVREIDVRVAEAAVSAAEAAITTAQANYDATAVVAPAAGRILRIHTRPGERVGDKGILELGDVTAMQAVAEIYEGDITRVQIGQTAIVKLDSTDEVFHAVVSQVGHLVARKAVLTNDPISDTDARVVEVRLDIEPSEIFRVARLSNARIEVSIETNSNSSRWSINR